MHVRTLIKATAIIATSSILNTFGVDIKTAQFGDVRGDAEIITNGVEIVGSITNELLNKSDKFIIGKNLSQSEVYYKLETSDANFPYKPYVYVSTTNLLISPVIYDSNMNKIPNIDPATDGVGTHLDYDIGTGNYYLIYKSGTEVGALVTGITPVPGLILNAEYEQPTTYGYSHPYDWNVGYTARNEFDIEEADKHTFKTNNVGQVLDKFATYSLKKLVADLFINYFDEVNQPNFNSVKFEVLDGPGTIDGSVLTASESGVVTVRGTASNGEYRDTPVSMYTYYTENSFTTYTADALTSRKRVNDYHLDLLQRYRSNPTTNRSYATWNSPENTKHVGNPGDMFNGAYGKHFFPYQHTTASSSGDASWWWSHAPISKHVVLAAHHYGWNHSRILNGYAFCNWDNKFSGKVQVQYMQYIGLSDWAASHGFEGTDAQCGDIGVFIVRTLDENNVGMPDECLPYLATLDWLYQTYGSYPESGYSSEGHIPVVTLNQANMVGLRSGYTVTDFSSWANIACEDKPVYTDGNILDMFFRTDLYNYVRLGGWHGPVMGDSGKPAYIYDPALTTGLTYDFGEGAGPEPLLRPILLACHTTVAGGTSVPRMIKVIKAFCNSIGDSLDHVLGNPDEQSTDTDVNKQKAKEYTSQLVFE